MASNGLSIYHLAYGDKDNKQANRVLNQNIASIISIKLTQCNSLHRNKRKTFFNLCVSEGLKTVKLERLCETIGINLNIVKSETDIIPIIQASNILENHNKSDTSYNVFIDGDTVFLRDYFDELITTTSNAKSDIALIPECGSTGITPYINYNCGYILTANASICNNLFQIWVNLCDNNKELAKHGNQRLFPHALGSVNPRIFSLDKVYNLRCHPSYSGIDTVWSPIYMIHNHSISNYWANKCLEATIESRKNWMHIKDTLEITLKKLDNHFTPANNIYLPRFVSSEISPLL